jgi:hypothetical protein
MGKEEDTEEKEEWWKFKVKENAKKYLQ